MHVRLALLVALAALGCRAGAPPAPAAPAPARSRFPIARVSDPRERHLTNLRQLTDGGENAEAYFSFDGKRLIFQSTRAAVRVRPDLHHGPVRARTCASSRRGKGRTTCAYFFPDGRRYLYASTHLGGDACPPKPDMSAGVHLGALRRLRHLHGAPRRPDAAPAHRDAGLRRRGDDLAARRPHRLHLAARRRPRRSTR